MHCYLSVLCVALTLAMPVRAQSLDIQGLCDGDCRVHVFHGTWVNDTLPSIFVEDGIPPWQWDFRWSERIVGVAVSKRVSTLFGRFHVEPEIGVALRTGAENTQEIWAAIFLRFDDFPWKDRLYTSIAISTGINYAFNITELERQKDTRRGTGSHVLHHFSPEISFGLPRYPDTELVFRFHHRSGGLGIISDTNGGANYGTVGLRFRF